MTDIKENISIDSLDEWLPLEGAESIIAVDEKEEIANVLKNEEKEVKEDLEDIIKNPKPEEEEVNEVIENINLEEVIPEITDEDEEEKKASKVKNTSDIFTKLVEKELLFGFDDDKDFSEYTDKDFEELIKANFDEREKDLKENVQKDFFDNLPPELQQAAAYHANGGTDMKQLFTALSQTEELKSLNLEDPNHQEHITRTYLYAKGFGDGNRDIIEDQIDEWKESGTLAKKAGQFKPILDTMQEEVVQSKIKQQEDIKRNNRRIYLKCTKNITSR